MSIKKLGVKSLLVLSLAIFASGSAMASPEPSFDISWLEGHWCSQTGDEMVEEYWLPMRGGLSLGMNRTVGKRGTAFEFMRIEHKAGVTQFIAQPSGAPPTAFNLDSVAPQTVSFINITNDFPKRVRYWRDGEALLARVDNGDDGGKGLDFAWRRCPQ